MAEMLLTLASSTSSAQVAWNLMVILLVASVVATVFARFRLESIPGFLVAGALVGPNALRLVGEGAGVEQISELAVVLLMFSIGLHLDSHAMGRGMVHILGIGVASTAAFIAMAFPCLLVMGLTPPAALAVSMGLSLSSTAIFVRIVGARRELRAVHARVGLGVSIVQDLMAVVMLAVLPFLSRSAGGAAAAAGGAGEVGGGGGPTLLSADWIESLPAWAEVLARAGVGIGGIVLLIAVARLVLPAMLRWIARTGSSELMLVFSAAVALAAAMGRACWGSRRRWGRSWRGSCWRRRRSGTSCRGSSRPCGTS